MEGTTVTEPNATPHSSIENSEILKLLDLYRITPEDLDRIRSVGSIVKPKVEEMVEAFYVWLKGLPEFEEFLSDPHTLVRVKAAQCAYWRSFFEMECTDASLGALRRVGETHERIGLPLHIYLAGMNRFLWLILDIIKPQIPSSEQFLGVKQSVASLIHLETGVVVETYTRVANERVREQSNMLLEMSTPVTQLWNEILMLPVFGIIDSKRAHDIMDAVLASIAETRARTFILDIGGVAVVDTAVANHLIKINRATQLMGCESTISGVSPAIARTIVDLGIDVGSIRTTATLRDALADAFNRMGMRLVESD